MKKNIKNAVNGILFILLAFFILSKISDLYRLVDTGRRNYLKLENETEDFQLITIGSSAIYTYWNPIIAKKYGISSYNACTDAMPMYAVDDLTEYIIRKRNPNHIWIDLRAFEYYHWDTEEASISRLSNVIKGLPFCKTKLNIINDYKKYEVNKKNILPDKYLFFDLLLYHKISEPLKNEESWRFMLNNIKKNESKGFFPVDKSVELSYPDFYTDRTLEINPKVQEELMKTISVLKKYNTQATFIITPYLMKKPEAARFKTLKKIINDNNYSVIDFNEYYDDIDLDFSSDFADNLHVNTKGAEKFTRYICNLKERTN